MNLSDLVEYARQQYGSQSDDFFTDSELYRHVWAAQMQIATEAKCIKKQFTTTSVADQQTYTMPTNMIGLKRASYDADGSGCQMTIVPLDSILDITEGTLSGITATVPTHCAHWGDTLYLGPTPADSGKTIELFGYTEPQEVTASSSLEIPSRYHLDLHLFLLHMKALKDKDFQTANYYGQRWEMAVQKAVGKERMLEKSGRLNVVVNTDHNSG